MITKFKLFEEAWNDKIGYYVILTYSTSSNPSYSNFFKNNIGQITKMYYPGAWFDVKFDNIPTEIEKFIEKRMNFNTADIKYISKDKQELEAILIANKYNI